MDTLLGLYMYTVYRILPDQRVLSRFRDTLDAGLSPSAGALTINFVVELY